MAESINYLIDGVNFKEWDITVSESNGLLDLPKLKAPFSIDWPDYHGKVVDLSNRRVEARTIELQCWMKATGKIDFATKLNSFLEVFRYDGTRRLTVEIEPTKPLLYEVYNESGISIKKQWRNDLMIGKFSLKLIEPEPVKRVIRHQRTGASTSRLYITLTSEKALTLYWGDGSKEEFYGTNVSRWHDYARDGVYFAVIAGVIENITNFSTTGVVVWNRL